MKKYILLLLPIVFLFSCDSDDDIDTQKPEINISIANAFPVQCSELRRGETFTFRAAYSDNVALGSYGLDIHHNFNHHSHSTEVETCIENDDKTPVNPFVFFENYTIPDGNTGYIGEVNINIPNDVDTGDYHFVIKVTDKAGWQTIKGLSIDITE